MTPASYSEYAFL